MCYHYITLILRYILGKSKCITENTIFLKRVHVLYEYTIFSGKSKCMMKTGDCVIKHPSQYTTGLQMVVSINTVENLLPGPLGTVAIWPDNRRAELKGLNGV